MDTNKEYIRKFAPSPEDIKKAHNEAVEKAASLWNKNIEKKNDQNQISSQKKDFYKEPNYNFPRLRKIKEEIKKTKKNITLIKPIDHFNNTPALKNSDQQVIPDQLFYDILTEEHDNPEIKEKIEEFKKPALPKIITAYRNFLLNLPKKIIKKTKSYFISE